jgi:branched-subunit amino acid ABC-type transport system permease component
MLVVVEQFLNGLQFGLLLFLLAAGLTLVFGIMDFVNLAHGSLYMMGAYFAATFVAWTGSFVLGVLLAAPRSCWAFCWNSSRSNICTAAIISIRCWRRSA